MTCAAVRGWALALAMGCGAQSLFCSVSLAQEHASEAQMPVADDRAAWRASMSRLPLRARGCFEATYPDFRWNRVECVAAPARAYAPSGLRNRAGRGMDWAAVSFPHAVGEADGSFSTSGLKREKGCNKGSCNRDTYSIQLNSGYFNSSVCSGSKSCWQQFLYSSGDGKAFMQYWLLKRTTCPDGWHSAHLRWSYFRNSCWKNSNAVKVPSFPVTDLEGTAMQGTASGGNVAIGFQTEDHQYAVGGDDLLGLSTNWYAAEFNVLGDGDGSEAVFNPGTAITVTISMNSTAALDCESPAGLSAETNNLTVGNECELGGSYVSYTESRGE